MSRVRDVMGTLASRMTEYAGEPVTFHRPNTQPVRLTAWRMVDTNELSGGDVPILARDMDWGLAATELAKLPGSRFPQQGDAIETADGQRYAVTETGVDSAWRWVDQHQQSIRIHTQLQRDVTNQDIARHLGRFA
jgi:hypothetical protein